MADKTENIRTSILFPMIVVGSFLIVLSLMGVYQFQEDAIESSVQHKISGVQPLFQEILQEESQLMNGQIDFIKSNPVLRKAFIARERSELYQLAQPLFERMRSKYKITHFYFHDKNQVCFLRIHFPDRYDDLIGRFTMKGAVATEQPFYGIELGPLGTFTLRTVHPWIIDGKLEGYIELGMEVEHIFRLIKQVLDLDILLLIEKKFLNRKGWEDGLKMLNRKGNWDLFHDFIIIDSTMQMTAELDEKLKFHSKNNDHEYIFTVNIDNRHFKGKFNNIYDAGNRRLGEFVCLVDITDQYKYLQVVILTSGIVSILIGGGLLIFFSRFIGRIQGQLSTSREKLRSEINIRLKREEELEALLSNSQVGIMVLKEGRFFHKGNQRLADILGYATPFEMKGISMENLHLTEERFHEFGEKYYSKLRNKEMLQIEYQLKRKDGASVWCMLSGKALDAEFPADLNKGVVWVIDDISRIKHDEIERNHLIEELQKALAEVKTLSGLLPICSYCKKIRDDKGYWTQIESYIHQHSDAEFSHSICRDCAKEHYPDLDIYED